MVHVDVDVFLAVARSGNLSVAAQTLFISQPALSARLKRLEQELHVTLFERGRGKHSILLTNAGKAFLPIAEKLELLNREALSFASAEIPPQIFSIEAVGTVANYVLAPVFRRFSLEFSSIHLQVKRHHSTECYDAISSGNAALGFVTEDQYFPSIETRPAFKEQMVLLARNDSLFCNGIQPEKLDVHHEVLIPWNTEFMQWHAYWFGSAAKSLVEVCSPALAEPFLTDKQNWIIAPLSIAAEMCSRKPNYTYYRLVSPPSDRIVYYLFKSGLQNEYRTAFLRMVHQQVCEREGIESFLTNVL